jgi:hypothetical protein
LLRFFAYSWDAHIKYDVCTTRESLEESTDPEPQFSGQSPGVVMIFRLNGSELKSGARQEVVVVRK